MWSHLSGGVNVEEFKSRLLSVRCNIFGIFPAEFRVKKESSHIGLVFPKTEFPTKSKSFRGHVWKSHP